MALVVGVGIFVLFRQAPALISVVLQSLQDRSKNLLFSSRRSPDGSHLIENIIDPGGPGGPDDSTSRISIRAKNGTENSLEFGTTAPGVFMRWIDETHVELWQEDHRPFLHGVDHLGDVSLITRTYTFPRNRTYDDSKKHIIVVPLQEATTAFSEGVDADKRICVLTLSTGRTPSFDAAGVEITATVIAKDQSAPRVLIGTRFRLEGSRDKGPQTLLTSATIADLGSYNRLPDGGGGTRIRGQFLGKNASRLLDELSKPSVTVSFARNFFEETLRYEIPLNGQATSAFKLCIGNGEPS